MSTNLMKVIENMLADKRVIIALSLIVLLTLAGYIIGFSQISFAHDTFHEFRHAVGLPCH